MRTTVFIALQCFQCSMMQVKQQKKSSNQWTCSVCNQKQSVRKVFAQGCLARDLRKFVQQFNLSQKEQTIDQELEELEEDEEVGERGEFGFESRIETEMPNKKIKLNNSGGIGSDASKWSSYMTQEDMEYIARPMAKVDASKWLEYMTTTEEDDREQGIHGPTMAKGDLNWSCLKQVDSKTTGRTSGGEQRTQQRAVMRKSASKWNYYLTQEEVDDQSNGNDRSIGVFQTISQDQTVEDDIHPDFI